MAAELLNDELKTRVPKLIKRELARLAKERHLKISDIAREAFRDYVSANNTADKEKVAA